MADQETKRRSCNSPLFQALLSAEADEMLSFDAVDEAHEMAGRNHSAEIGILKAEINGKFEAMQAGMDAKFEGVNKMLTGLYVFITVAMAVIGILIKT